MPESSPSESLLDAQRQEVAQITETLLSGGYDGTEGDTSDTTWTDFGIVCGIAERLLDLAESAICRRFTVTACVDRPEVDPADYCARCAALNKLVSP